MVVFSAYIYYMVPHSYYTDVTSYVKASALLSCVVSGVLGDVLVTQYNTTISTLMVISAICVCFGFLIGLAALRPAANNFSSLIKGKSQTNYSPLEYNVNDEQQGKFQIFFYSSSWVVLMMQMIVSL